MRPWISFAVLAFLLLTASNAFATGELEKRLMKEGWVKLTAKELKALKDFTATNDAGWAEYIDPSGTKVVTEWMSGDKNIGRREITADGQYCHHYEGAAAFCWFLWKRGKIYFYVTFELGDFMRRQFTIKPGNTENL